MRPSGRATVGQQIGRRVLPCIAAVALLSPVAGANGATNFSARAVCAAHTCRTLLANKRVRIFRASDRHGYEILFGEWRPTGELREITFPRSEPVTAMALVGTRFAYADRYAEGTAVLVYLQDMRPRRGGGGWIAADDLERGSRGVSDLALTPSGTISWLIEGRFSDPLEPKEGPHPFSRAIFAVPAGSDKRALLAYGNDIEPGSLTATGGRVHWLRRGVRDSYPGP